MIDTLNTFIESAFASITAAQVATHYAALAKELGFSAMLVIDTAKLETALPAAIVFASAPEEVAAFDREIPFLTNPIVHHATIVDTLFAFADVCAGQGLSESELRRWLPDPDFDLRSMCLPVHRNGRLMYYVACFADNPDTTRSGRALLHTCAHALYDRNKALSRATLLSPREADCLYWVSQGKTYFETGDILKLASRTVRAAVAAAKKKLGARSKSEAIAKAIALSGA